MRDFANKLIKDHRHPLFKAETLPEKLFLHSSTSECKNIIKNHQQSLENILRHSRVDKRGSRAQGEWLPELHLVKIFKLIKNLLSSYGFQDINGQFLYSEEALFLLETNRLEILHNGTSLSIQEAYKYLSASNYNLINNAVFKKLSCLGYRVVRYSEILRRQLKFKKNDGQKNKIIADNNKCIEQTTAINILPNKKAQKRKHKEGSNFQSSIKKISLEKKEEIQNDSKLEDVLYKIIKILDNICSISPKSFLNKINEDKKEEIPDFCVFLPTNKTKLKFDFKLKICKEPMLDKNIQQMTDPTIFAVCTNDNVAFLKVSAVSLPNNPIKLKNENKKMTIKSETNS